LQSIRRKSKTKDKTMMTTLFTSLLAQPVDFLSECAMFLFLPAIATLLVALVAADRTA
jgi:hypothetical protein